MHEIKSCVTLHLRHEADTCQLDRFVIRITCGNVYMCVVKNMKHLTNTKGLLLILRDEVKKQPFDQSMMLKGQWAVTDNGLQ